MVTSIAPVPTRDRRRYIRRRDAAKARLGTQHLPGKSKASWATRRLSPTAPPCVCTPMRSLEVLWAQAGPHALSLSRGIDRMEQRVALPEQRMPPTPRRISLASRATTSQQPAPLALSPERKRIAGYHLLPACRCCDCPRARLGSRNGVIHMPGQARPYRVDVRRWTSASTKSERIPVGVAAVCPEAVA